MARSVHASQSHAKNLHLFLNTSFLLLLSIFITSQFTTTTSQPPLLRSQDGCSGLHKQPSTEAKCRYVQFKRRCQSKGYLNYLHIFFCTFGRHPVLGYSALALWLLLLFYLLGNTAAYYFCSSLESLSRLLRLSPTIAGVTLLALGNGASDVFSSTVSFVGSGESDFGLNSVLGGAFFISSVVVGVIGISVAPRDVSVNKPSFVRDVFFFILALSCLMVILAFGRVTVWGAAAFASLYLAYVLLVSASHFCRGKDIIVDNSDDWSDVASPLLSPIDEEVGSAAKQQGGIADQPKHSPAARCCSRILRLLELPLYLPRRLTIPVVSEEQWSKPFAVSSALLAPILLGALWASQADSAGAKATLAAYLVGALCGLALGALALATTESGSPPRRLLLPWLAGGFLMSMVWTYIIAQELIALLVAIGHIIGVSPSILGLTVLAWGNSVGDLVANLTIALNGGADGAQIAISGCYAGPIFNTLVGLGLPLLLSAWKVHPAPYVIPLDPSLFQTLGFLVAGLLWALVILPRKSMRLDRVLGGGLLAIYLCFLSVRLACTLWLLDSHSLIN